MNTSEARASIIEHYNQNHRHASTRLTPNQAWEKALTEGRSKLLPKPEEKLPNLHFALHIPRRVSSASTVEFLGRLWKISPTSHKFVLIIHHPNKHFCITEPVKRPKTWPTILGSYSL